MSHDLKLSFAFSAFTAVGMVFGWGLHKFISETGDWTLALVGVVCVLGVPFFESWCSGRRA
jgi:putative Mn2+ efflux pump MntP